MEAMQTLFHLFKTYRTTPESMLKMFCVIKGNSNQRSDDDHTFSAFINHEIQTAQWKKWMMNGRATKKKWDKNDGRKSGQGEATEISVIPDRQSCPDPPHLSKSKETEICLSNGAAADYLSRLHLSPWTFVENTDGIMLPENMMGIWTKKNKVTTVFW